VWPVNLLTPSGIEPATLSKMEVTVFIWANVERVYLSEVSIISFLMKSDEYKSARCRHFSQSDISKEQRVGYD
jgi:hypothetical protein